MTLGPIMLDLKGTEVLPEECELLAHPAVGGVIIFSRNYETPEQLQEMVAVIRAVRTPPLLIAVDQEGGRVQRFRDGFTRLPPAALFGKQFDQQSEAALQLAESSGWLMATELTACGVDLSFAPVLDLDRGVSSVIGDRAFHQQPAAVADLAQAYQRGMHSAGMASVGKHFPGHGAVTADSHKKLPEDDRSFADIQMEDLVPFQRLAASGLNGMMAAHVLYTAINPQPAGFSRFWLTDVLRGQLDFQGAIFSDDLSMGGAAWAGSYIDRAHAALEAGCDMALVCNHPDEAIQVVESLEHYNQPASAMRLSLLHARPRIKFEKLGYSAQWQQAVRNLKAIEKEPWLDMDME
ncbi:MAG: beta-N-acetylhexosaminidase [Gammaproteobacteria bacterium]